MLRSSEVHHENANFIEVEVETIVCYNLSTDLLCICRDIKTTEGSFISCGSARSRFLNNNFLFVCFVVGGKNNFS